MVARAYVRGREVHPRFRLALAVAALVVAIAPAAHAAATPVTWCGGAATATDRPDTFGGDEIHVIYATPSDSPSRFSAVSSAIATDIGAIDAWWRKQDPTRAPRWDLAGLAGCNGFGSLDITDAKLTHDTAYYNQATTPRLTLLRNDLVAAGFNDPTKRYLVYYDQAQASSATTCGAAFVNAHTGGSAGYAGVFIAPNLESAVAGKGCGSIETNGIRGGFMAVIAAQELTNDLGALDNLSSPGPPHKCPNDSLHPCDNSLDVLSPAPTAQTLDQAVLDYGHDDYYAHAGTWWDVQDSPWLRHLDAPEWAVTLGVSKGGSVVDSGQPSMACASGLSCSWTFSDGTLVNLNATADLGYRFIGWTGCPSASGITCTATVNSAVSIRALFAPPLHVTNFHLAFNRKTFTLTATVHLSSAGEADLVGCSFGAQPVRSSSLKGVVASCSWSVPLRFAGHRIKGEVELDAKGQSVLAKVFHLVVPHPKR